MTCHSIQHIARATTIAMLVGLTSTSSRICKAETPIGTTINYSRNNMKLDGVTLNGIYDVRYLLWDHETEGMQIGHALTKTDVSIASGQLPARGVDFGDGAFDGGARWIEVRVRQGGNEFRRVGHRVRFLAVPYALSVYGIRIEHNPTCPNIVTGHELNSAAEGVVGATISGGGVSFSNLVHANTVTGNFGSIGGGILNSASALGMVGGGRANTAGEYGAVCGGEYNVASGDWATVPGGWSNTASGRLSFAAGTNARALHLGSFVWGDHTSIGGVTPTLSSAADNDFTIRATGGFRFFSNNVASIGVQLAPGGNSWSATSDRNAKENFVPIEPVEILNKVTAMPITRWNLISQEDSIHHIGPMAQDFHAAFGLGEDDRHISQTDADGIALAAIQGLHVLLQERDVEINALRTDLAQLREELNAMRADRGH
jgi:hypothetical protein